MFEKALITRIGDAGLDLGLLAETVFFYGATQLLLNRGCILARDNQDETPATIRIRRLARVG